MGFFRGDVYSYALDKMTPVNVYLPWDDNRRFSVKAPQRTLILLHGLEGNSSYWSRYTSVERYAQRRNLAVIMPEAEMSMYADMRCGQAYARYIGEELPKLIGNLFQTPTDRDRLSIAGLSMGGYGALRMALTWPEIYGRCAVFSGALMLGSREHLEELRRYRDPGRGENYIEMEEIDRSMYRGGLGAYGENLEYRPEDDILYLAEQAVKKSCGLPRILMTCGTEDFLLDVSREYSKRLGQIGVSHEFKTWKGVHDWQFWEECIRDCIDFFC